MHEMIIQERINARDLEFSKMAEDNRLLALLDKAPSRSKRIGNPTKALFVRSFEKLRVWSRIRIQRGIVVK
jgi:hypothetical protein